MTDNLPKPLIDYSIGEGWRFLVEPLRILLTDRGGTLIQVKEKFGGLRFYYDAPTGNNDQEFWRAFQGLVDRVEDMCNYVSEEDGKPTSGYRVAP